MRPTSSRLPVPQFILQPIIENTIEHGFTSHTSEMLLNIHIYDQGKDVYVVIRDNGVGMSAEKLRAIRAQLVRDNEELFSSKNSAEGGIGFRNVDQPHQTVLWVGLRAVH